MRSHLSLPILATSLLLTGCDEQARTFAAQTLRILQQRSTEISTKIAVEKAAYSASAVQEAEDRRALTSSTLRNERLERSTALAADYIDGRRPISQWRKDLADYGNIDYQTNMQLFTADIDSSSQYLQGLEILQVEQDKVDALAKLLGALAKKESLKSEVEAIGQFADDSNKQFNIKVCNQLKTNESSSDATVKAAATAAYMAKDCDTVLK